MRCEDPGVCSGSEMYLDTPSSAATEFLYYLTSCGRFFTEYDYRIEREDYHNYLLLYVIDGRLSITSDGKTRVADKGKLAFINCHKPHEYHTIGNAEFIWIHLNGANTESFHRHILQKNDGFVFSHPKSAKLCMLLEQFIRFYQTNQVISEPEKSRWLYSMLILLLDTNTESSLPSVKNPLDAVIAFISENYAKPITLNDMAAHINMSPYHFSRLFKKNYGYSPHEYLMLMRINRAKHLLKTTDLPVKIIAQQVGYINSSTFSSAFTEKVGLSPKGFRLFPL